MAARLIPMDPSDAAWYHMDWPANEVLVTGLVLTDNPVALDHLRAVIKYRLLAFERFRQRVVEHGFPVPTPHWQDDPAFNLDAHLHCLSLPEPGDKATLLDLVGELASQQLDHQRPLWQVHLVERFGQGSAVVMRYHHCLADGTAMMALVAKLLDTEPDAAVIPPAARSASGWLDPLFRPARALLEQSLKAVGELEKGVERLANPGMVLDQMRLAAEGVGTATLAMVKPPDTDSPLRGRLSGAQRVAYSAPVPVPLIKRIGRATGTTINDVLIAAMSGAVRHYLEELGSDPYQAHMRAVVPVNLRHPQRALDLGNVFGLTFLDLPVEVADPLERLMQAKAGMDAIKRSPEAMVLLNLLIMFGQTPKPIEDIAAELFGSKATMVMTNVMGPKQPLYLAGSRIEHMLFFVPHPVSMGLGISLLSYNDEVLLGVISDAAVLAEPARISDRFVEEIELLRAEVELGQAIGHHSLPRVKIAVEIDPEQVVEVGALSEPTELA
jgi:diacylglycerol O-acyltransferase